MYFVLGLLLTQTPSVDEIDLTGPFRRDFSVGKPTQSYYSLVVVMVSDLFSQNLFPHSFTSVFDEEVYIQKEFI